MNVRFYAQRANQALSAFLGRYRSDTAPSYEELSLRIRAQHIRFLQEARFGEPLQVECGLVSVRESEVEVLELIRKGLDGELLTTFVTTVGAKGLNVRESELVELHESAGPRGLTLSDPLRDATGAAAQEAGYRLVGRGVIGADECGIGGIMMPHYFIGRVSDSVPNIWQFGADERLQRAFGCGEIGSAVLEYRLEIKYPLRAGSQFSLYSGLHSLGNRTYNLSHVLIDDTVSHCAARAEAVGALIDLSARRAVAIDDDLRQHLTTRLIRQPLN